jgi:hypothetical protein
VPYLKKESTPEMKAAVLAIEHRADDCYKTLPSLNHPRNIAMWRLLTSMARQLEVIQQKHGPTSRQHTDARINIERHMCGFHFIALHAKLDSRLVPLTFTTRLGFRNKPKRTIFDFWCGNPNRRTGLRQTRDGTSYVRNSG